MLTLALLPLGLTAPAQAAARPDRCATVLDARTHGAAAITKLGDKLPEVAANHGMTAGELRSQFRNDNALWVDACGALFYVDPAHGNEEVAVSDEPSTDALVPLDETFSLQSKPGSPRVLYLDFNGHTLSGTAWNTGFNLSTETPHPLVPYDTNGVPGDFDAAERQVIQSVWQRVSEDFAPFDVNVTTADPGQAAITRDSYADLLYGSRVVVTGDTTMKCGCGGIAYLGVFDIAPGSTHAYYQPALVFTSGVGTQPKNIAEAASHEAGHNLGLNHDGTTDGTTTVGYYRGHGAWAPIMGVGYNRPVTQWSRGEYAMANNTEDDFSMIASHGVVERLDDHGGTAATASPVQASLTRSGSGVIASSADTDVFAFAGRGETTIAIRPAEISPNLDIHAQLLDASGNVVATADPAAAMTNADVASGLDASLAATLASGTYYLAVRGTGFGDPLTTGYSTYGSIGSYDLAVQTGVVEITTSSLPNANVGEPYTSSLAAQGNGTITWRVVGGALPAGVSLSGTGDLTGVATSAGTSSFTVEATDAIGRSATAAMSLTAVVPPPDAPTVVVDQLDRAFTVTATQAVPTRPQTGMRVLLDGVEVADTAETTARVADVTPGQTYAITVAAYGPGGDAPPVTQQKMAITTPAPLGALRTEVGTTVGSGSVRLSWDAVSSTAARPLSGYRIYRNSVVQTTVTDTSYTATGLTNGEANTFEVRPYGAAGEGTGSSADATALGAPAAVAGLVVDRTDGGAQVSWTALTSTAGEPVDGYRVSLNGTEVIDGTQTSLSLTDLTPGEEYVVSVVAYGAGGASPPASEAFTAITKPVALSTVSQTTGDGVGSGSVRLTWSHVTSSEAQPRVGYRIYLDDAPVTTVTGITYTAAGLTDGQAYDFEVRPYGPVGEGTGAVVAATPIGPPAAATALAVTRADLSAELRWIGVTDTAAAPVTGYRVEIEGVEVADGSATSWLATGLQAGREYPVKITTYGAGGDASPLTGKFLAISTPNPLGALTATAGEAAGSGSVQLDWDAVEATAGRPLDGYRIYVNDVEVDTTTEASYTVTELTNGTLYNFEVRPYGSVGEGTGGSANTTPVSAPAAATEPTVVLRDVGATVNWTAAATTDAAPVTGYTVELDDTVVATTTDTSWSSGILVAGSRYRVTVTAEGPGGSASPIETTFDAIGKPLQTSSLTQATGATVGPGKVRLKWAAVTSSPARPSIGYRIYRRAPGTTTYRSSVLTSTSFLATGLINGKAYSFEVRAVGSEAPGWEGPGRFVTATPVKAPAAVKTVKMAKTSVGVKLTWSAVTSTAAAPVAGYRVYRGTTKVYQGTTRAAKVRTIGSYSTQPIKVYAYGRGGQSLPYTISALKIRTFRAQ